MAMMRSQGGTELQVSCAVPRKGIPHQRHLVRFTHIFSSAVRELLEVKLLAEITRDPLSLSQFHLLRAVALNGDFHSGELADFMGVSAPAGTKNIDKLERLGFIVRNASKWDRRVRLLSASAKGRRLVRRYEERKARSLTPVLGRFSSQELRTFARLLERFTLSLIEQEETDSGLCLYCAAYCIKKCPVGRVRGGCPFERLRESHGSGASAGALA
jgi:DNA-binding MarR family transcriptional regulator